MDVDCNPIGTTESKMGIGSLSQRYSGLFKALTTHPHLTLRLQQQYSYTSTPLLAFMNCSMANFPFTILIKTDNCYSARSMLVIQDTRYKIINETLNAFNSKSIIGGIFLSQKAFDCLNHSILLSKLQFYGVNGKTKSWFEPYLNNRHMRVQISDEGSNQMNFSAWEKNNGWRSSRVGLRSSAVPCIC